MRSLILILSLGAAVACFAAEPPPELPPFEAVTVDLIDAPHPKAHVTSVDAEAGTFLFSWLDAEGNPVDSGNSIGRFTPSDPIDYPDAAALATAITAEPPPPAVPVLVSRRQLRQWLILEDKLAAVEAVLDAIPDETQRALARNWWDNAIDYERAHPLVASVGAALSMTSDDIDQAFREAANL